MTKIEMGKQYRTRDGREVRIYAINCGGCGSVHGAINNMNNVWDVCSWDPYGKLPYCSQDHVSDLIEVKPRIKRDVWVNVYQDGSGFTYGTKEEADKYSNHRHRLACVKLAIDVEEGEGL